MRDPPGEQCELTGGSARRFAGEVSLDDDDKVRGDVGLAAVMLITGSASTAVSANGRLLCLSRGTNSLSACCC